MDFVQSLIDFFNNYGWPGILCLLIFGLIVLIIKYLNKKADKREQDLANQLVNANKEMANQLVSTFTKIEEDRANHSREIEHQLIETIKTTITGHYESEQQNHLDSEEHRINMTRDVGQKLFDMLRQFNAQRASIMELHNGGVNLNGLSFIRYDITYEKQDKGVTPIMQSMQGVQTSVMQVVFDDIMNSEHNVIIYNKEDVDNLWDRGATSLHSSLTRVRNIDHIVYAGIFNDDNLLYGLLVLEYQNGENTFHPDIVNEVEIAKWTSEISQLYKYIKKY